MTPDDLARIHADSFTLPRPWSRTEFEATLADPTIFLVTRAQGFILGRCVLDEAELLTLAVAPEARRRGIGQHLLTAFEASALQRGADTAFLEVAVGNDPACALYRRNDWYEAGRRRSYYAPGIDGLVMRKELRGRHRGAAPDPGIFSPE